MLYRALGCMYRYQILVDNPSLRNRDMVLGMRKMGLSFIHFKYSPSELMNLRAPVYIIVLKITDNFSHVFITTTRHPGRGNEARTHASYAILWFAEPLGFY